MITENSLGQKINNPENFWKWFGNSIMVDNQGRPIVFYHGTDKKFTEFKSGYSNGLIFFTYDKTLADKYSKNKSINHGNYDGKRDILGCYLKINKLFVPEKDWELILDDVLEIFKFPENTKELVNADENKLTDEEKKEVNYYHEYVYWIKTGNWIVLEDTRVVERIWSKGFDAIQLAEETDEEQSTIAVKENSNQIKSIDNKGTWSKTSDNIYEAGYNYNKGMSNNAVQAYNNGEMPKSKWTKTLMIDTFKKQVEELYTEDSYSSKYLLDLYSDVLNDKDKLFRF